GWTAPARSTPTNMRWRAHWAGAWPTWHCDWRATDAGARPLRLLRPGPAAAGMARLAAAAARPVGRLGGRHRTVAALAPRDRPAARPRLGALLVGAPVPALLLPRRRRSLGQPAGARAGGGRVRTRARGRVRRRHARAPAAAATQERPIIAASAPASRRSPRQAGMDELCIVTTGGTIDKVYFDDKSDYQIGEPQIGRILTELGVAFRFT